ncbi:MAG: TetR/AcrR family transcriptional regulator [Oscillospiraceae bacterium]|nr:TetR/AcrR family transcriptional regulator [Oscillospiraceae bacterium]
MPKIIENLESRLIEEAKKQIEESGYTATTIRSVAKACGVGVGTVYNYFPSKDDLLATYMLSDWNTCVTAINAVSTYSESPAPVVRCIYDHLLAYAGRHQTLFRDAAAAASFAGSFSRYHTLLRSQLASPLRKFCGSDFAAEFIAEALLSWTMAGKTFDEIYGMIGKLF